MNKNKVYKIAFSALQEKGIFDGKIDYILEKDSGINDKRYICYLSRKNEIEDMYSVTIDTNRKVNSYNVPNWDFNIDDFLFNDLENDYRILEMSADTHYGVWYQIDKLRDEINNTDGLQKYLAYCKQNHIDKNFMKQFYKEIDVMDLYQEKVNNYVIISSTDVGTNSVVLAYNKNAPSPYVTWETTPNRQYGYSSGHYFSSLKSAFHDYQKRTNDCLESHFQFEKTKLQIKENKEKAIER